MENVYVLMVFIAALIGLVGCGLLKVSDILEKKRDEKYYQMIRQDAAFWQMKAEQTGMNIMDWTIQRSIDEMKTEMQILNDDSDEPKEV